MIIVTPLQRAVARGFCRTRKELEHPGCEGLAAGIQLLSTIKNKFTALSYAGRPFLELQCAGLTCIRTALLSAACAPVCTALKCA